MGEEMWHTFILVFQPQIFKQTSLYALYLTHQLMHFQYNNILV